VLEPSGVITLLTDFGNSDAYAGTMKGVILQQAPAVRLIDLTHEVRPQDILEGAFLLDTAYRWFPRGTVHLVVVDPGVGTERPPIAFEAGDYWFVGPDNGLFTFIQEAGIKVATLRVPPEASATFHGRDVFAPAAARLAAGMPLTELGTVTRHVPMRHKDAWAASVGEAFQARVLHCDRFGNLITNVAARFLPRLHAANGLPLRVVRTYGEAPPGELVALVGSSGRVEVALAQGSAAARLRLNSGDTVLLT
jgi:S-adenosylmethionine hydrolase